MAIEAEINQAPTDCGLLKELREVDDQIARGDIKLNDEVEMKLTDDEKTAHSNARRTHQETTESFKKSRGKIYSLLLGRKKGKDDDEDKSPWQATNHPRLLNPYPRQWAAKEAG